MVASGGGRLDPRKEPVVFADKVTNDVFSSHMRDGTISCLSGLSLALKMYGDFDAGNSTSASNAGQDGVAHLRKSSDSFRRAATIARGETVSATAKSYLERRDLKQQAISKIRDGVLPNSDYSSLIDVLETNGGGGNKIAQLLDGYVAKIDILIGQFGDGSAEISQRGYSTRKNCMDGFVTVVAIMNDTAYLSDMFFNMP